MRVSRHIILASSIENSFIFDHLVEKIFLQERTFFSEFLRFFVELIFLQDSNFVRVITVIDQSSKKSIFFLNVSLVYMQIEHKPICFEVKKIIC